YDKAAIFAAYKETNLDTAIGTHVLDMVFAFSSSLWLLILFLVTLLSILLMATFKIWEHFAALESGIKWMKLTTPAHLQKVGEAVIACVLKQHSSSTVGTHCFKPIAWLYFLIVLTAFYTAFYLTSMIKTEM